MYSTGCIAILEFSKDRDVPTLLVSNLGDSGACVIRDGKQVFRTREQQVEFNMPYQMGTGSDIEPKIHAESSEFALVKGDWIVMGSDGLFDNLDPSDIIKVLKKVRLFPTQRLQSNLIIVVERVVIFALRRSAHPIDVSFHGRTKSRGESVQSLAIQVCLDAVR